MKNDKSKKVWWGVALILLLFIFQQFASKIGGFVANIFTYNSLDEYGIFAWISVHHFVQMILALIVIVMFSKMWRIDFGFHIGRKNVGLKYVTVFSAVILIYVLISYTIGYSINHISTYEYPLNTKNVLGSLGFQLLLSGTSEEILFRALPITMITCVFGSSKVVKIAKLNIPFEIIISALLFSSAHISWTINPFSMDFNCFQLMYAFILGIIYGVVYKKSSSIIYPMILHSISNVLMVGIGYIFAVM